MQIPAPGAPMDASTLNGLRFLALNVPDSCQAGILSNLDLLKAHAAVLDAFDKETKPA